MRTPSARTLRLPALILGAVLVLTGCGGEEIAERIAEEAGGADNVEIDPDSGEVHVEGSEGSFSIGGGDIPDGFPDELPIPDGLEVAGSASFSGGEEGTAFVQLQGGDYDELTSFYESELPANGWTVEDTRNVASDQADSTSFAINGHGFEGLVNVQSSGGSTGVLIQLSRQGSG